jgi:hypothetical protein
MEWAFFSLGYLYADQGKLGEAEKMYMQALQGYEEALGSNHTSTLSTVGNLGNLYADHGKLGEVEKMYKLRSVEYFINGMRVLRSKIWLMLSRFPKIECYTALLYLTSAPNLPRTQSV